jgi:ribosomal protein S18 acetylase RimI-like enzyme
MSGDLEQYARTFQSVADEGRFLFTEKVTPERKEHFRKSFLEKDTLVLVGEVTDGRKKRIVGSLTLSRYGHAKKIPARARPRNAGHQGLSAGRHRHENARARAQVGGDAAGRREGRVGVFSSNPCALRLYRKFGFEVEGVRGRQYYIGGKQVDEIDMALFLK